MKRFFCLLLALCLTLGGALAEEEDLDAQVRRIFKAHKAVGGTVLAAKDGEIVYQLNYGYADKGSKTKVTDETYFRIASVTKMVSAIRVMQLVEDGTLDLDEDLSAYLGFTLRNPYAKDTPITLRHLMTHTSSLSQKGGYGKAGRGISDLLALEGNHKANYYDETPGTKYRYSNFGAGLMGSVLEAVTGRNVNDAVTEGVFAPLGIDAAYHASLVAHPENVSSSYDATGGLTRTGKKAVASAWDASVNPEEHYMLTVGSVWITGQDLCRLGMLLCEGGALDGVTLLRPETVREMMSSQKGKGGVQVESPYGLCVYRDETLLEDRMIYGHQGMSEGIACNVYFDPQSRFVFVMISNGCSNGLQNRICAISRKLFAAVWAEYGE